MMKHILVLAYAISPTRGSEYSVSWNYVVRMSKYNRLTVIFGASGDHMGDTKELEMYAKNIGVKNVKFVPVKPNTLTNGLNWFNKRGYLCYTFYLAYNSWQKQVYAAAKKLVKSEHFDLIHFLGPIGYREPGYLWKLGLPYMWGPIGGVNRSNDVLQKNLPFLARLKFGFRNIINEYQLRHKKRIRDAVGHCDLLLTATTETQNVFSRLFGADSVYLPENSILEEVKSNVKKDRAENDKRYHFVIIGSLIPRKAVNIFLEALAIIKNRDKIVVDIVGDGSMRSSLEKYAEKNNLTKIINWHGQQLREKAVAIFKSAQMHVITSISEGNATVIWEAMSYGVPTMSFDHCGMHDIICEKCGIRIPIVNYEQCIADLAGNIDNLLDDPSLFEELSRGTIECAKNYTFDIREKILLECYDRAIENYNKKFRA